MIAIDWLPVQGIHYLIDHKFIRSNKPEDIARFLLRTEGLNKATIGEYLGDGYVSCVMLDSAKI